MTTLPTFDEAQQALLGLMERLHALADDQGLPGAATLYHRLSDLSRQTGVHPRFVFIISGVCELGLDLVQTGHLGMDFFPLIAQIYNLSVRSNPDRAALERAGIPAQSLPQGEHHFRVSSVSARVPTAVVGPRIHAATGPLPCLQDLHALHVPSAEPSDASPELVPEAANSNHGDGEPDTTPSPLISLAVKRIPGARGLCGSEYLARVAERCTGNLVVLSRHRMERHLAESSFEERTILRIGDALSLTGSGIYRYLEHFWAEALDLNDAYRAWAMGYACAVLDGSESLAVLGRALCQLPERSPIEAHLAAEALSLVPRPDMEKLVERWMDAGHPVLRSTSIGLQSRMGRFRGEQAVRWLRDPNLAVVETALNALAQLPDLQPATAELVGRWMLLPDRRIAWAAARCLLLHGRTRVYAYFRKHPEFAQTLGPDYLEFLILCGSEQDLGGFPERLHSPSGGSIPITRGQLDQLGRLGLGSSRRLLLKLLDDRALSADAADALELMFGEHPDRELRTEPDAWQQRFVELHIEDTVRYRAGHPWGPSSLAMELSRGKLSRRGLGLRLTEFRVRLGRSFVGDPNAWDVKLRKQLEADKAVLEEPNPRVRPGSFDCVARR